VYVKRRPSLFVGRDDSGCNCIAASPLGDTPDAMQIK